MVLVLLAYTEKFLSNNLWWEIIFSGSKISELISSFSFANYNQEGFRVVQWSNVNRSLSEVDPSHDLRLALQPGHRNIFL